MELKSVAIPKDWTFKELGSLCEIYGRIGFRGYTVNDIVDEGQGAITISPSNINNGKTNFSKCTYLSWLKYEESPEIQVQIGDILLVKTGSTVGKVATVFNLPQKATVNPQIVVLKKSKVPHGYLGYQMNFNVIQGQLNSSIVGGALPTLSQKQIAQFKVPVPPSKQEQEAIANALSDADAYIESLEKLIAKKRLIKKGVMQELLTGKRRLEGFKAKWQHVSLGDIADPKKQWSLTGGPFGSNLKSSDYTADGIRVIQLQNIGDGEFKADYEIFTSKKKADELINCNIYAGEIILSKMGDPVARACIIPSNHDRYLMCSDGIRLAVNQDDFDTYFICEQINSSEFRKKADNAGTGSTRKRIGLTELRNLALFTPEIEEQRAISVILKSIDSNILLQENKLQKARLIKQGMMQELLTGRIRLV